MASSAPTDFANEAFASLGSSESYETERMRTSLYLAVRAVTKALDATYINFMTPATINDLDLRQPHKIILFATGTHALAQWHYGEDVHLIGTADSSDKTFWAVVKEKLQLKDDWKQPKSHLKYDPDCPGSSLDYSLNLSDRTLAAAHTVHDTVADIIKLCQKPEAGCKIYLHFTKRPRYFLQDLATENEKFEITRGTNFAQAEPLERHLDTIRDMRTLASVIMKSGNPMTVDRKFTAAYSNLHYWALNNGIIGRELGYLDSETLIWNTYDAFKTGKQRIAETKEDEDPITLITRTLYSLYDHFNAAIKAGTNHININTPSKHLTTAHLTTSAVQAIRDAITKQASATKVLSSPEQGLAGFLSDCSDGLLIASLEIWQHSPTKVEELREQFREEVRPIGRFAHIIHGEPNTAGVYTRIWPEALVEEGRPGRFVYAIAVCRSPGPQVEGAERLSHCSGCLVAAFVGKPPSYNTAAGLIEVRQATAADFHGLLREPVAGDLASTATAVAGVAEGLAGMGLEARFRTAGEVIGRLRHDPAHAGVEYDVGYEDRFAGTMWKTLEEWGWGGATEDEEWIPEHRVRQVRRRGDRVVVWDRVKRVDLT